MNHITDIYINNVGIQIRQLSTWKILIHMVFLSPNPYKSLGIKELIVRLTFKDGFRHPEKLDLFCSFYKWVSKTCFYIIIKMTNEMFYTRSHWQLMFICPIDNIVVWFCSLHRKPSQDMKIVVQRYVIVNYII